MSMLCALVDAGTTRLALASLRESGEATVRRLLDGGFLVADGVVDTVVCDACGAMHEATVTYHAAGQGYVWHCPELGRVEADPADLCAVALRPERFRDALVAGLGTLFGSRRGKPRRLGERGDWLLGIYTIAGAATTAVFGPGRRIEDPGPTAAIAALPRTEAGLVLIAGGDAARVTLPTGYRALPLESVATIGDDGALAFDRRLIERTVLAAVPAKRSRGGRPALEAEVWSVLDALRLKPGTRGKVGAVRRNWKTYFPDVDIPVDSTLQKHVASWCASQSNQGLASGR